MNTANPLEPTSTVDPKSLALEVATILRDFRFDQERAFPAEPGAHAVQVLAIAEAICAGADLDVVAGFPQDFIYRGESLLHLMAMAKRKLYVAESYATIENAVELLTSPNASGSCRFDLGQIDGVYGFTPLHYAACYGSVRLFQLLLNAGASLDVRSTGGMYADKLPRRTPLQEAHGSRRSDIAQAIGAWKASSAIQGILAAARCAAPEGHAGLAS